MAIENFENKNIQDTFQRVVQTDGTNQLADGTGSIFIPISSSHAITSSHALFAVSASHEVTFELSSSHAQTADALTPGADINVRHVTASGNISASGDGIFDNLNIDGDIEVDHGNFLKVDGANKILFQNTQVFFLDDIKLSDSKPLILGTNSNYKIELDVSENLKITSGSSTFQASIFSYSPSTKKFTITGDRISTNASINTTGNITASGNISASATSTVQAGSGSFHVLKGDTTQATGLEVNGFISATGNISASGTIEGDGLLLPYTNGIFFGGIGVISKGGLSEPLTFASDTKFDNNITASGNISASGNIISVTGSFDYVKTNKLQVGAQGGTDILSIDGGDLQLENNKQITFADIGDGNTGRVRIVGNEDNDTIFMHVDNSNTKVLSLTTTGVGIGTTSPGEKLEVVGNISASGEIIGIINGGTF